MVENLVWLMAGVMSGYFVGVVTSHMHSKQLLHLAKMKIMADTGHDPMLVEIADKAPELVVPAPRKKDGIREINERIQQKYDNPDLEVM